jgi:hypothetical protein
MGSRTIREQVIVSRYDLLVASGTHRHNLARGCTRVSSGILAFGAVGVVAQRLRSRADIMKPALALSLLLLVSSSFLACGGKADDGTPIDPARTSDNSSPGDGGSNAAGSRESGGAPACTAAPACDANDRQLKSESDCQANPHCYKRTACGVTILCGGAEACTTPDCPSGSTFSPTCSPPADCTSVSACNGKVRITCETCEANPTCDDGDTQMASQADCPQHDVRCYSRLACQGARIWCWGPL